LDYTVVDYKSRNPLEFGVCYAIAISLLLHKRIAVRSYKSKAVCFYLTLLRVKLRQPEISALTGYL